MTIRSLVVVLLLIGIIAVGVWVWFIFDEPVIEKKQDQMLTQFLPPQEKQAKAKTQRTLTQTQREQIRQLESIGYVNGTNPLPKKSSVTKFDPQRAFMGLNLYVPADRPQAILIDMRGKILHRWHFAPEKRWPQRYRKPEMKRLRYWRRVYLFPNGDLLGIYPNGGMVKINKDSELIWSYEGRCHHDLEVTAEGSIFVLTRKVEIIPELHPDPVLIDYITQLDDQGREKRCTSVLKCIQNSEFTWVLKNMELPGDILHTNTVEIFDGSKSALSPLFKKGNALVACLEISTVAILDLDAETVIWAAQGPWMKMHQPVLMDNGHLLIFDNLGNPGQFGSTRIVEYDMSNQRIVWEYGGNKDSHFETITCGSNSILPNGNILISESDHGRAFEITRDGDIVWEYIIAQRGGRRNDCISLLFEMIRYQEDYFQWLDR